MLNLPKWVYRNLEEYGNCFIGIRDLNYDQLYNHIQYKYNRKPKIKRVNFYTVKFNNNRRVNVNDGEGWVIIL